MLFLDLDGDNDVNDRGRINTGDTLGYGALSLADVGNRKGYAGYELAGELSGARATWHVRHRVLDAGLGRWTRRDPAGLVDGANLYAAVRANPIGLVDSLGQLAEPPGFDPDGNPLPVHPNPHPDVDESCCAWACSGKNTQGTVICCHGRLEVCNCLRRRPDTPGWEPMKKHTEACIDQCEPLHLPAVYCLAGDHKTDPHPYDPNCGQPCSEEKVVCCISQCLNKFDCNQLPPANRSVCETIKERIRQACEAYADACAWCWATWIAPDEPIDPTLPLITGATTRCDDRVILSARIRDERRSLGSRGRATDELSLICAD